MARAVSRFDATPEVLGGHHIPVRRQDEINRLRGQIKGRLSRRGVGIQYHGGKEIFARRYSPGHGFP
jgi:hypothetical protein